MAAVEPRLRRCGLPAEMLQRLQAARLVSVREILTRLPVQLVAQLDISHREALDLQQRIAERVVPAARTVAQTRRERERRFLSTGLGCLDEALKGGIHCGSVTEIVGPAGVGKSQLCLGTAVQVCINFPEAGVVYIDTEGSFSPARVREICADRSPPSGNAKAEPENVLSRIIVLQPRTSSQLLQQLSSLKETLLARSVCLVVIDSVAAPIRREFSREDLVQRQDVLANEASVLKSLAESFRLAVLVTNQVVTRRRNGQLVHRFELFAKADGTAGQDGDHDSEDSPGADGEVGGGAALGSFELAAALGTSWAHCVNTRLVLESTGQYRQIRTAKSPLCPALRFPYRILRRGIELISDVRAA